MHPLNQDLVRLRKNTFKTPYPLSQALINSSLGVEGHHIFVNPASHLIYLYMAHYIANLAKTLAPHQPLSSLRILDWGCGKGQNTFLLRELGLSPTTCDLQSELGDSAYAQETPIIHKNNMEVIPLTDDVRLPFESNNFDFVLSYGVLEHVKDERGSLREIHRVLKSGGLFCCFFVPYRFSWTQNMEHMRGNRYHDRPYTKKYLRNLLGGCGYEVLDIWHRQLFPKNRVQYPNFYFFERLDQFLCQTIPLKWFATNVEFVARKI